MLALPDTLTRAGVFAEPGRMLADAGYWSHETRDRSRSDRSHSPAIVLELYHHATTVTV